MLKGAAVRSACTILLLLFLQAGMMGAVCPCKTAIEKPGGKYSCSLTVDICGKSAPAAVFQSLDAAPPAASLTDFYFPNISVIPPAPAKADASADPGDTDKPPKA